MYENIDAGLGSDGLAADETRTAFEFVSSPVRLIAAVTNRPHEVARHNELTSPRIWNRTTKDPGAQGNRMIGVWFFDVEPHSSQIDILQSDPRQWSYGFADHDQ